MYQNRFVSRTVLKLGLSVCLLGLASMAPAFAAGVVSATTEANLRAALEGGGTVTFSVSGTITVTSPLVITNDTVIDGSGQSIVLSGGGTTRVITSKSAAHLVLKRVAIANGYDATESEDSNGSVGGVYAAGNLSVSGCTFSNNAAFAFAPRVGALLFDSFGSDQRVVVTDSTFVNNHARDVGAMYGNVQYTTGGAALTNCTFVGNTSDSSTISIGGPVIAGNWVVNSTFAYNTNLVGGASLYYVNLNPIAPDAGLKVINSLFAFNTAPVGGKIVDLGHNLVSGAAGGLTNVATVANTDPLLASLADNGGPTWTMALQTGSPALDAAYANAAPSTDQRGILRTKGVLPDIGAFEGTQLSSGTTIRFAASDFQVGEAGVLGAVWIERVGPSAGTSSVDFSATAGTAVAGSDFAVTNGTVTFGVGETLKTVYVPVLDDSLPDGNETVALELANPVNATLEVPTTATLTILDNESAQSVAACTYVGVFNAISNGGWYVFDCDATIVFPAALTVVSNTVLDANGHNVIFDGNNAARFFNVSTGKNLTLKNLKLTRGNFTAPFVNLPGRKGDDSYAGAILVQGGVLNLLDCLVSSNRTEAAQGANYPGNRGGGPGGTAYGGAIALRGGAVNAARTEFRNNVAVGGASAGSTDMGGSGEPAGSGNGGALWNQNGHANLEDCVFIQNTARGGNGSEWQISGSQFGDSESGGAMGGALAGKNGSFAVKGCLFQDNLAASAEGRRKAAETGGLGLGGAAFFNGNATVLNSTFSGNQAQGGSGPAWAQGGRPGYGGGIFVAGGTVDLVNVTLATNSAFAGTNSILNGQGAHLAITNGTLTLVNTIVAGSLEGTNVVGTITDLGHNLSSDGSAAFTATGSLNSTDPLLGPLADNGGPTHTVALLPGSPALDAADDAGAPATDQRGLLRPFGTHSDIGAYEAATPFVLQGRVSGLSNEVQVIVNSTTLTTTNGWFGLVGQAAGSYTVTPTNAGYVFVPASRTVTLGPDQPRVDFTAYEDNSLTLEGYSSGFLEMVYAGKQAQHVRVLVSTNGTDWTPVSTHNVSTNKVLQLTPPLTDGTRLYRTERVQ